MGIPQIAAAREEGCGLRGLGGFGFMGVGGLLEGFSGFRVSKLRVWDVRTTTRIRCSVPGLPQANVVAFPRSRYALTRQSAGTRHYSRIPELLIKAPYLPSIKGS